MLKRPTEKLPERYLKKSKRSQKIWGKINMKRSMNRAHADICVPVH